MHRQRPRRIRWIALACVAFACGEGNPPPADLVLVTVDSLRSDRLACYGGPSELGEHLCALADDGALFVWAFTSAPSGAPAAASLLTSQYVRDHGVGPDPAAFLPSRIETVAERLSANGFATAAFVSSPELNRSRNLHQGFGLFDDRLERAADPSLRPPWRGAAATTNAALRWLAATPAPRFAWVHYGDLHGPFVPEVPSYEDYEARYREALLRIDDAVDRLLSHWAGAEVRPGVAVAGLHGESTGEDGRWFTHGHSVGLELIRVPLVWLPPGPAPAQRVRVRTATSLLDVAPTLLAAARAAPLGAPSGERLPMPGTPPRPPGRAIFAEHPERVAIVSDGTYLARPREAGAAARFARLAAGGTASPTRPALSTERETLEPLERQLRGFLGQAIEPADPPVE